MFKNFSPQKTAQLKSHIANLCQLALADAVINQEESDYLAALCEYHKVSQQEFEYIMDNAFSIPFISPDAPLTKLEQMYDLVRMVLIDEIIDERKVEVCVKVAHKLGFGAHIVGDLIKALVTVNEDTGVDNLGEEDLKLILKSS